MPFAERVAVFGNNVYPTRRFKSFFELIWNALKELTLIILSIAAVISLILKLSIPNTDEGESRGTGWIEGASILATVAIVAVVTAANDYAKDKQFRALEQEKDNDFVIVLRNGEVQQIQVFDLVVGDIVCLVFLPARHPQFLPCWMGEETHRERLESQLQYNWNGTKKERKKERAQR